MSKSLKLRWNFLSDDQIQFWFEEGWFAYPFGYGEPGMTHEEFIERHFAYENKGRKLSLYYETETSPEAG